MQISKLLKASSPSGNGSWTHSPITYPTLDDTVQNESENYHKAIDLGSVLLRITSEMISCTRSAARLKCYLQQDKRTQPYVLVYGSAIDWDIPEDDDVISPSTCLIPKSLNRPLPIEINTKKRPKQTVTVTLLCVPKDDVHKSTKTRPVIKRARVITPGVKNRRDGFHPL